MIHESEILDAAEQILSRHYAAICESKRVEVAFVQPRGQADVVTLKDVIVYLLAMILLIVALGKLA
jgi:hypothetical protein